MASFNFLYFWRKTDPFRRLCFPNVAECQCYCNWIIYKFIKPQNRFNIFISNYVNRVYCRICDTVSSIFMHSTTHKQKSMFSAFRFKSSKLRCTTIWRSGNCNYILTPKLLTKSFHFIQVQIVGGNVTSIYDYPWTALLRYRNERKQVESWVRNILKDISSISMVWQHWIIN